MLGDVVVGALGAVETNKTAFTWTLVALLLVYKLVVYPLYLSPLREVPGPYIHRITRLRALHLQRKARWISTVRALHKRYGNVVILSPTEISVDGDYKYINDIYVKNFPKSPFYENFRNHGGKDNMFASLENDRHLKYKKIVQSLYSKSAIFSPNNVTRKVIVNKVAQLADQVQRTSVTGERPDYINAASEWNEFGKGHGVGAGWFNKHNKKRNLGIDVYSLFGSLAMDVVLSFELGEHNGTDLLLHPEKRHIIVSHRLQASMGFWTTLMPRLWNWAASPEIKQASRAIEEWQLGIYRNAEENVPKFAPKQNPTTLEAFKKAGYFNEYAYSFLSDNIFAGHETTAIQLTYMTYELSRPCNQVFQQRLIAELQNTFGKWDGHLVIDSLEVVDKLPYLDAVFQENSRVHSLIPGAEPRVTNVDYPVYVGSKKVVVPVGTTISCQPYSMHRVALVFPDPEVWNPERWLPHDETPDQYDKRIARQQKYMMPFGKGIRMCLGMNLALIEMKMAVANLYWRYNSRICADWCEVTDKASPIELGSHRVGSNSTDYEKMVMVDTYTSRPYNDECWLEWYEN